jgi:enediyne biosynthesis protein E4
MHQRRGIRQIGVAAAAAAALALLPASPASPPVRFVDVTRAAGIAFRHRNAASPEKRLIETMGSGCGWIDYDRDGLLDLYLVNSAGASALYRNRGDGTFADVTARAGVAAPGLFGMGVAIGDYDNDGYPDLLVLGYAKSMLYRNNGDGTFRDVTLRAGLANNGRWASSAAWFDYDNDGRLDVVIANYVDWTPDKNYYCGAKGPGLRSYCHPDDYHGVAPTLYHNNGDGTFTDVSRSSGLAGHPSNGLGVVTFDYDEDGRQDILIANDGMPNSLFRNNGDGTFTESAYDAGVAVSEDGTAEAGMGIDAADASGKGRQDLVITHLDQQHMRFYRNLGRGYFEDATAPAKLAYATFQTSGFGVRFLDYDNDGWPDIFVGTGHVLDNIERYHPGVTWAEPKQLFRNLGAGLFADVSKQAGAGLQAPTVTRGLAAGDYDNDGDMDVVLNNNGGSPQLLRNDGGNSGHWLEILLVGTRSNRDAVGARVRLTAGDRILTGERKGGMSYESAQDPRLHFGLGNRARVDALEVRWPSGAISRLTGLAPDRILTVEEPR